MSGGKIFRGVAVGRRARYGGKKLLVAVEQILRQRGFARGLGTKRRVRRAALFDADEQGRTVAFAANRRHPRLNNAGHLFQFVFQIALRRR